MKILLATLKSAGLAVFMAGSLLSSENARNDREEKDAASPCLMNNPGSDSIRDKYFQTEYSLKWHHNNVAKEFTNAVKKPF